MTATYPDKTQKTAQCVLVGGVWVGTIEGSPASGTCTNGYTVIADGIDENGNPVSGYVLGRGDVEILKEDGTPIEDPTHFVTDDELDAAISSKAEISDVDDVANDLADLSNSLSGYYTKSETSSATEIQTALDGYVTSAQVEPAQYLEGYADKSVKTLRVVKEVGTAVDESTYLATVQGDNDKQTDAVIRSGTYDSFFLSSYNGETFDPPIELKYGYCTRVYRIITIGGRDRIAYVTINSNAWYAQLERTFHLIKAEYTRPYYWPVESMYLSATSYPVTYDENKTSVETVNGQSGVIACARATQYPTESAWPLAYRDEVSAKADLSALTGYLPLSGGNMNGPIQMGPDFGNRLYFVNHSIVYSSPDDIGFFTNNDTRGVFLDLYHALPMSGDTHDYIAYRRDIDNAVSGKADLSSLSSYLPLSGGQLNGVLSVGTGVQLFNEADGGVVKISDGSSN